MEFGDRYAQPRQKLGIAIEFGLHLTRRQLIAGTVRKGVAPNVMATFDQFSHILNGVAGLALLQTIRQTAGKVPSAVTTVLFKELATHLTRAFGRVIKAEADHPLIASQFKRFTKRVLADPALHLEGY